MSKELEPCPFCAQPSPREEWFHDGTRFFNYIECFDCGARGAFSLDKEKAKRDWNARAVPPGYVTEEECRQRCFDAWQAAAAPLASRKLDFLSWYAENYEEKDD